MGILNITPDSFSDGDLYLEPPKALEQLYKLISAGADLIDIGAESTRPNATLIDENEEWQRLEPILKEITRNKVQIPLSIDTRKAIIAQKCLEMGVKFINDVSSLEDPQMVKVLAKFPESSIVLTHHRGLPVKSINAKPNLNLMQEIIIFFEEKLRQLKNNANEIILDMGFGFGKGLEENILMLKEINCLQKHFGLPVLIGLSRKRFVKELWPNQNPDWASVVLSAVAVGGGANIIRCHEPHLFAPLKQIWK